MELNRFKQLLESKLGDVRPLINEQEIVKQGPLGDPYKYKQVGNEYFFAKKDSENWTKAEKQTSIDSIKSKIFGNKTTDKVKTKDIEPTNTNFCPVISDKTKDIEDIKQILSVYKQDYNRINSALNTFAKIYSKVGEFPQRISCQIALNKIRPGYKDKNLIIVDTLQKVLYLFNKNNNFIEKTQIISGKNKQSTDPKNIAMALLSWDEQAKKLGFKYDDKKGYVDATGKNRKYDPEYIYSDTDRSKTRYLPKGIYTTDKNLYSNDEYAGKTNNILSLFKGNKEISQAIHGYYLEKPRTVALNKAKELLNNPTDTSLTKEFLNSLGVNSLNLSQSYGCINVPNEFLPTLRTYMRDSYVFNIGESGDNYLVNNTENYFDKMLNSESCPSPKSLGAEPVLDVDNQSDMRIA